MPDKSLQPLATRCAACQRLSLGVRPTHILVLAPENAMKAIVQSIYGSADVLEFIDIDMPVVGDCDVFVRARAAGLHIDDWHVMTGLPYMLRVVGFGLRAPNVRVRGIACRPLRLSPRR